ncbi:MAG TPA: cation transporter [Herpetosiphonaceae bacterium]
MYQTTFRIPQMDCAAEEQLVRMSLAAHDAIQHLAFNLGERTLIVTHTGEPAPITRSLEDLQLGAELVDQQAATDVSVPEDTASQRRLLMIVLLINASLFVVEVVMGLIANSMGLVADSLDMLADALVYGLSLYAVGRAVTTKRRVARTSGYFQFGLAFFGLAEVIRRVVWPTEEPAFGFMIGISILALVGNVVSLLIIQRNQDQEAHMQASRIFTANDVVVNLGVISAGLLVWLTNSRLPDLVVGAIIFVVVARGAWRIVRLSRDPAPAASGA